MSSPVLRQRERDDDFDAPATPARTLSFIFSAMMSKYFENAPFPQRESSQRHERVSAPRRISHLTEIRSPSARFNSETGDKACFERDSTLMKIQSLGFGI
jgi:hypothetical protein